jgi:hypothetical protein
MGRPGEEIAGSAFYAELGQNTEYELNRLTSAGGKKGRKKALTKRKTVV